LLSKNVNVRINKTTILPVILYGCETWSLTVMEEHKERVLRMFGPKRDGVTGGRGGRDMWHEWGEKNVYRLLVGKPESKGPLGRTRCRWMDNIKMVLLEIGLSVVG
jgi:hypothetical protein